MVKRAKSRSDETRLRGKEYVAYQTAREFEERYFKRGFDAALRVRNKEGRLVLAKVKPEPDSE